MIAAKLICPLLLLAGFINFSSSSTTTTYFDLHDAAIKACNINSTSSLIDSTKQFSSYQLTFKSEGMCPIACYVQKLGIANDVGLNKIAVNWVRTFVDLLSAGNTKESIGMNRLPEWTANKSLEGLFYMSHTIVDPLGPACSSKNETAFETAEMELESIKQQYEKDHPDGIQFTPSDEDSPILELIQSATESCSTKFNTSSFLIAMNVMKSINSGLQPESLSVCYIHCMLSELEVINEVGLTEAWARLVAEDLLKHEKYVPVFNDVVALVNSKCSSDFNDLPDNYWTDLLNEFDMKIKYAFEPSRQTF